MPKNSQIGHIQASTLNLNENKKIRRICYSGDLKYAHSKSGNIWNLDFLKVVHQMVRFLNGQVLAVAINLVPLFKNGMFLSGFHMVLDKMPAICPDFKRLGFQILDPIRNPDHLQPNHFTTIWNQD